MAIAVRYSLFDNRLPKFSHQFINHQKLIKLFQINGRFDGKLTESDKPLTIGGIIIPPNDDGCSIAGAELEFCGHIDELRISNVRRYLDDNVLAESRST